MRAKRKRGERVEVERSLKAGARASVEAKRKQERRERRRGGRKGSEKVSGDDSWREPPVPIPNTEVKPPNADGTELGTAWESRKLPGSKGEREERKFFPLSNIREQHKGREKRRYSSVAQWQSIRLLTEGL